MSEVDVVIPLYNCTSFIEQAIASVQGQTVPVRNIIVVNDGSTDDGPEKVAAMAAKDKRIILLSGPNRGLSAARNKGIRAATSSFVAFLDADDLWAPAKIEQQLAAMHDRCVFSHTLAEAVDEQGQPDETPLYTMDPDILPTFDNIRLGLYSVSGSASAVLARRELLVQAGLFDEEQRFGGEDWDVWARLAQFGEVVRVDSPLTRVRIRRNSLQRSMSAETRALSRLHSRIIVAHHWENDPVFLHAHALVARTDLWAVMRWHLLKPCSLRELYLWLRAHPYLSGRVLAKTPWAFLRVLLWGCGSTLRTIIGSPRELLRLWGRFCAERRN